MTKIHLSPQHTSSEKTSARRKQHKSMGDFEQQMSTPDNLQFQHSPDNQATSNMLQSSPGNILRLQRLIGNRATINLLRVKPGAAVSGQVQRAISQTIQRDPGDENDPVVEVDNNQGGQVPQPENNQQGQVAEDTEDENYLRNIAIDGGNQTAPNAPVQPDPAITDIITRVLTALPEQFQTDKNPGKIDEMFGKLGTTVEAANKLADQVLRNADRVLAQITSDWKSVKSKFKLSGTVDEIKIDLTGSDFHKDGQQVLMIKDRKGNKVVYKPRSTSPDTNLIGSKNSVVSQFNKWNKGSLFSKGGVQLPTMKFLEFGGSETDEESNGEDGDMHSYVEFQHQSTEKTNKQTLAYYRQMGALAVIAKLTGTEDLHYDNIMSVQKGATIIDAETSFLPHVMQSVEGYAATFLQESLNTRFSDKMGTSTNYFENTEGVHDFSKKEHRDAFVDGADEILQIMAAKKGKVITMIVEKMQSTTHSRLVPVATQDFDRNMLDFRAFTESNDTRKARDLLRQTTDLVIGNLRHKGFQIDDTHRDFIQKTIKADFLNSDIPIFHYENRTNEVTYHEHAIGSFPGMDDLHGFVKNLVDQMIARGTDGIKQDFKFHLYDEAR